MIYSFDTFIYCIATLIQIIKNLSAAISLKSGLTIYININNDLIYSVLRGYKDGKPTSGYFEQRIGYTCYR
jgi:hypothetical protein